MAIQFPRGTGAANDAYTGLSGEFSIDFDNSNVRVHDGTTAGGAFSIGVSGATGTDLSANYATGTVTITSSTGTNATINAATTSLAGVLTSADKTKLDGIEAGAQANVGDTFDSTATYASLRAQGTTRDDVGLGTAAFSAETTSIIEAGNFDIDFGVLGA